VLARKFIGDGARVSVTACTHDPVIEPRFYGDRGLPDQTSKTYRAPNCREHPETAQLRAYPDRTCGWASRVKRSADARAKHGGAPRRARGQSSAKTIGRTQTCRSSGIGPKVS